MNNQCNFSTCRRYRYTLEHVIEDAPELTRDRRIQWIGLNPSTADEQKLDNTLRRIRSFSLAAGFGGFVMTNVFAYRATKPADMRAQSDPVGPLNDEYLEIVAKRCEATVACWGGLNKFPKALRHRAASVRLLFARINRPLLCLGLNDDGSPEHPLFVDGETTLQAYTK
jgi:hypothetical protein